MKKFYLLFVAVYASTFGFASEAVRVAESSNSITRSQILVKTGDSAENVAHIEKAAHEAIDYLEDLAASLNQDLEQKISRPDCWLLNFSPDQVTDYTMEVKKIRFKRPRERKPRPWLALTPGDVIYYYGAFGVKFVPHWGVYIGRGKVLEKWRDAGVPTKGRIVISNLLNFGTDSQVVRSCNTGTCLKSLLTCQKEPKKYFKEEPNKYRQVYIAQNEAGKKLRLTPQAVIDLMGLLGHTTYNPLGDNCIAHSIKGLVGGKMKKCTTCLHSLDVACWQTKNPKKIRSCKAGSCLVNAVTGAPRFIASIFSSIFSCAC